MQVQQLSLFDTAFIEIIKPKIGLEEVFQAYFDCRKNKRNTANALAFEVDYEIISASYSPTKFLKSEDHLDFIDENYECDFILKSSPLPDGKYKHSFFNFEGEKKYEIISKYTIDFWGKKYTGYYEILFEHEQNENGILRFYAELPGKFKPKKKTVCYYNLMTKQFYK